MIRDEYRMKSYTQNIQPVEIEIDICPCEMVIAAGLIL